MKKLVSILLSLCLGFFLVGGAVSVVDDSLVLLTGLHLLTPLSAILSFIVMLMAALVYGLIGLSPSIPKRMFLLIPLFCVACLLTALPTVIYFPHWVLQADWIMSCCQVLIGLAMLGRLQGGLKLHWPIVSEQRLGDRLFSWQNLSGFVLVNVFVLLPAIAGYLAVCAALAVNHFSEGFMAVHRNGLTVQVRKYVRADGKTIQLVPMAHIAEADFYRQVSQLFPSNCLILMEGVTDREHRLTIEFNYQRTARSLGLTEQRQAFEPTQGEVVMADVDTEQFSTNTVEFLNLVGLVHSRGVNPDTVQQVVRYSPPRDFMDQLTGDLLRRRNQHLLDEIQARLPETEYLVVPWGVAHMPGIATELQKSGFRLVESREYTLIRFHFLGKQRSN